MNGALNSGERRMSRARWNFSGPGPQYLTEVDDAALLRKAGRGDESAFCALFDRFQRPLYQYAARMCGAAAADDVVQDTFLAVLRPVHFDESKGNVAAYLFGIARHHISRRLSVPLPLVDSSEFDEGAGAAVEGPLEILTRHRTIAAVRAAVDALPPLHREVVVLCDLQELDYAAVAEVIKCPIGTVRSRLHRGRAQLARLLASETSTMLNGADRG
jgi:RNA polymerase sigma-70 factor (ECF subfamily)